LHFILSESSSFVKTDCFQPRALHSFFDLRSNNTLVFKSAEAEGISQVEENRIGCRKAISDKVKEAEHYHDGVNLQREHLAERRKVDNYAHYHYLNQKVY